jgi:hypothetical protein
MAENLRRKVNAEGKAEDNCGAVPDFWPPDSNSQVF